MTFGSTNGLGDLWSSSVAYFVFGAIKYLFCGDWRYGSSFLLYDCEIGRMAQV